ncbi:glycosyl transferase [marine actinobacterium PHSC20C1]|nr:glycosyl transferase [marine actinobacterium PHSC20C1]
MHIAHVTSFYSVPALSPSSAVRARGIAYRAAGHEFTVIMPGAGASVEWTEYGTIVTVPARGAALRRGFVAIPRAIGRALDRLVPDRLEVADRLSFRQLGVWARENHVPAVLFADDVPTDWASDRAVQNYDRVICSPSSPTSAEVQSSAASRQVFLHPGVDLEIFTPLRHNSALRDTSGAATILVCAAPLTATGSVSTAIDVVRHLINQRKDTHLVVLGDGPLRSRLERSSHGLPVQFLSAQTLSLAERSEVFATADFALVTLGGSIGHAVALESLASGTPVILSGTDHIHIEFGNGGGLNAEEDMTQIAHAVAVLSEEPVESRRRAARDSALPFDAMPLARAMVTLHESLGS